MVTFTKQLNLKKNFKWKPNTTLPLIYYFYYFILILKNLSKYNPRIGLSSHGLGISISNSWKFRWITLIPLKPSPLFSLQSLSDEVRNLCGPVLHHLHPPPSDNSSKLCLNQMWTDMEGDKYVLVFYRFAINAFKDLKSSGGANIDVARSKPKPITLKGYPFKEVARPI